MYVCHIVEMKRNIKICITCIFVSLGRFSGIIIIYCIEGQTFRQRTNNLFFSKGDEDVSTY